VQKVGRKEERIALHGVSWWNLRFRYLIKLFLWQGSGHEDEEETMRKRKYSRESTRKHGNLTGRCSVKEEMEGRDWEAQMA
jgi:hypothetical protein